MSQGLLLDQHSLFIFYLTALHQENFGLVKFVALHLEYLRLQLVYQYLLPVQILLQFLHGLDPFDGCVRRLSLFCNLSLVSLQQFLFFVLLGGN